MITKLYPTKLKNLYSLQVSDIYCRLPFFTDNIQVLLSFQFSNKMQEIIFNNVQGLFRTLKKYFYSIAIFHLLYFYFLQTISIIFYIYNYLCWKQWPTYSLCHCPKLGLLRVTYNYHHSLPMIIYLKFNFQYQYYTLGVPATQLTATR